MARGGDGKSCAQTSPSHFLGEFYEKRKHQIFYLHYLGGSKEHKTKGTAEVMCATHSNRSTLKKSAGLAVSVIRIMPRKMHKSSVASNNKHLWLHCLRINPSRRLNLIRSGCWPWLSWFLGPHVSWSPHVCSPGQWQMTRARSPITQVPSKLC